jgi:MYXO-CTERM domain-containing protein
MTGRALLLAVFTAALLAAAPAAAVSQCGPDKDLCQCGMNNPYPCCSNGGNCTWWSWDRACCHWKVGLPGWGNANQWAGNARNHPSYNVVSTPVVGSIAVRVAGDYGHVAWVTAVSGSSVTVTEQNCWGGWGHQSATRDKSFYDGGFIVKADVCECSPGQTQTQSCGQCGSQKRTCGTNCRWGAWSTCGGQGACLPGQTEKQGCGQCGTQQRTCSSSCSWGAFGTCSGQGVCTPGQTERQACGKCGWQERSCSSSCGWSAWGACSDEGECAPGESETLACGDCGSQSRSCGSDCRWGEASACSSNPEFAGGACDTGNTGICAEGVERCVEGNTVCAALNEPAEEICDGLDNNCNGWTDEGVCGRPSAPDPASASSPKPTPPLSPAAAAPAAGEPEPIEGGCACSLGRQSSGELGWLALALAMAAGLRRRRGQSRSSGIRSSANA